MKNSPSPVESWVIGALSAIALITFFFPLISIHVPLAGDIELSGYDAIARGRHFRRSLELRDSPLQPPDAEAQEGSAAQGSPPTGAEIPQPETSPATGPQIPLSVHLAWLIPLLIIVGYSCALLSFCGCFSSWLMSKVTSTIGALCGFAAILQTVMVNSDMHAMYEELMSVTKGNVKDDPFSGFLETMGNLVANAFQLKPSAGLYILTSSLGIAAFLAHSRILSRIRLAPPDESGSPASPTVTRSPTVAGVPRFRMFSEIPGRRNFVAIGIVVLGSLGAGVWYFGYRVNRNPNPTEAVRKGAEGEVQGPSGSLAPTVTFEPPAPKEHKLAERKSTASPTVAPAPVIADEKPPAENRHLSFEDQAKVIELDSLADADYNQGGCEKALPTYQQVLQIDPRDARAYAAVQTCYAKGGYHPSSVSGGDSNMEVNNLHPNFSIEVPTILSDTRGVDFGPYLSRIVFIVRRNWEAVIPNSARLGEKGRVGIVFEILKDGSVPQLRLISSSGMDPLDSAAMTGIRSSVPFPPLPTEFTGNHLVLQFVFLYNFTAQ